ncbi:unnamed protein product [Paramecium sonneborni]|uniref:Uncharacterized protein n=1 Tax=Paramecium sonneborni TaxID=65129 RepID=A0A8S1M077_9CILI|nr:unnamed protein product [Paramecium sonneborni]
MGIRINLKLLFDKNKNQSQLKLLSNSGYGKVQYEKRDQANELLTESQENEGKVQQNQKSQIIVKRFIKKDTNETKEMQFMHQEFLDFIKYQLIQRIIVMYKLIINKQRKLKYVLI